MSETAITERGLGFAEGDRVFNDQLGAGTVIAGSASLTYYTVAFDCGSRWVVFCDDLAPLGAGPVMLERKAKHVHP